MILVEQLQTLFLFVGKKEPVLFKTTTTTANFDLRKLSIFDFSCVSKDPKRFGRAWFVCYLA